MKPAELLRAADEVRALAEAHERTDYLHRLIERAPFIPRAERRRIARLERKTTTKGTPR